MKDLTKTISQVLFIIIGFVFIVLITSGFSFNSQELKSLEFWGEVVIKEVVLLVFFNIIYDIDRRNRTENETSAFHKQMCTRQLRVKEIYDKKMFNELRQAVKDENKQRLNDEITRRLHKVTVRVSADDLPGENEKTTLGEWIVSMKNKYQLNGKIVEKLEKVAGKIFEGKIKVYFITEDDILLDYDQEYARKRKKMSFNKKGMKVGQTAIKGASFLVSAVVMTCVTFAPVPLDALWQSLLMNVMLLLSAFISGIASSAESVAAQTDIIKRQNLFLNGRMGLTKIYKQENN